MLVDTSPPADAIFNRALPVGLVPEDVKIYVKELAELGGEQMVFKSMADPDVLAAAAEDSYSGWTMVQWDEEDWIAEYKNKADWCIHAQCEEKHLMVDVSHLGKSKWTFVFSKKNEGEVVSMQNVETLGEDGKALLAMCQKEVARVEKRRQFCHQNPAVNRNLINLFM